MKKMILIVLCALILLMFGALALFAAQNDELETQKAIESVVKANEGIMFARMTHVERGRIARAVVKYAGKFALDPWLVLGVIRAESAGRPNAQNGSCVGLMQVSVPLWGAEEFGDIYDIEGNVHAGCYILRYYLNKYNDIDRALLKYSGFSRKRGRAYLKKAKAFAEGAK